VYRNGEIIAESHNLVETSHDPTAHAEIRAIRLAGERLGERRLNDCTLIVTLEPCTMCAGAIILGRVGRLIYGASDPKAGGVESVFQICSCKRLNHRPEVFGGVLRDECGTMLTQFFKRRRHENQLLRDAGVPKQERRRSARSALRSRSA
jgi:tRNA(adenine34) deaminase